MTRDLPPLAALRAFEAAARHQHFTAAARDLGLTASAVSHQIKRLEESLGAPLFVRQGGAVRMTDLGREYLVPVREALDAIAAATDATRRRVASGSVLLAAPQAFLDGWLAERSTVLRQVLPRVMLKTCVRPPRGARSDLEVRLGDGQWDGLRCELLHLPAGPPDPAGGQGYYLVWHRSGQPSAATLALRQWLLAECAGAEPAGDLSERQSPPRPGESSRAPRAKVSAAR